MAVAAAVVVAVVAVDKAAKLDETPQYTNTIPVADTFGVETVRAFETEDSD